MGPPIHCANIKIYFKNHQKFRFSVEFCDCHSALLWWRKMYKAGKAQLSPILGAPLLPRDAWRSKAWAKPIDLSFYVLSWPWRPSENRLIFGVGWISKLLSELIYASVAQWAKAPASQNHNFVAQRFESGPRRLFFFIQTFLTFLCQKFFISIK